MSDEQLADFLDGRTDFVTPETPASGLGPIFNDVSCVACHSAPTTGGASRRTVTRFGHTTNGSFDPLEALGGSLLQARAIRGVPVEVVPAAANVVSLRLTTPLFGAGLIEAIPDATIIAQSHAPKPAGIRGKVSVVTEVATGEERVGRFGWKAQQATLLAFSGDAYRNEMGITNRLFPTENAPNGNTAAIARFIKPTGVDDAIDPLTGRGDIDRVAIYMRLLAPPPSTPARGTAVRGAQIFASIACAACHLPAMTTGQNAIAALSEQRVELYSDLLLHDMGSLGDGIAQGSASTTEMRTAPLWGLRARPVWLHDGRARTIDEAIRAHDGEAANARSAYVQLNTADRQSLLDFLNTL